jgi:hypothetical protein
VFDCGDDGKEFFVVNGVVYLCGSEFAGVIGYGVEEA